MKVAPLPQFGADELASVLEEEVVCWRKELDWDYRASAESIARCLNSRSLRGHVLRSPNGDASGYCYHLVDGPVAYIGNFFVRERFATPDAYRRLLTATLADLRRSPHVERIECQFVPFNCEVSDLFLERGFEVVGRRFLARRLGPGDAEDGTSERGGVTEWNPAYLRRVAEIIRDSYRSSSDYDLCADYQSLTGVLRFLRNLIDNAGCGAFCARASVLGFDDHGGPTAVLLSSRIGSATHMIPQLSVAPRLQNRGWGTALLLRHFARARREGSTQTVLCVSDRNQGAARLYRRLGFEDRKLFQAFVWKARE